MSAAIEAAKRAGLLVPAAPVVRWAGAARVFLMCRALYEAIESGRLSNEERVRRRWAQLEADIGHFVEGGFVTEGLLKQLKPEKFEHWELVSRRPKPSLRVFGRFAAPDVFVGTHVVQRRLLGGMWSPEFEHEKLVCEELWQELGLPDPFHASRYEDYITENATRQLEVPE
ncbi:MAG TPA: hypothetical protein VFG43_04660 [Geminicoccaceae bacterium]|nr:hypothetical protein [Geminicoccaceae bacterium]